VFDDEAKRAVFRAIKSAMGIEDESFNDGRDPGKVGSGGSEAMKNGVEAAEGAGADEPEPEGWSGLVFLAYWSV
jgi:hypothetical protein